MDIGDEYVVCRFPTKYYILYKAVVVVPIPLHPIIQFSFMFIVY